MICLPGAAKNNILLRPGIARVALLNKQKENGDSSGNLRFIMLF